MLIIIFLASFFCSYVVSVVARFARVRIEDSSRNIVGAPRVQNMANLNAVRQIAKFGMIVYYKIVINNLI